MEQGESRRASAVLWPPSTSHAVMFTHETGTWPSQRRTRIGAPAQLWSGFPSVEACYPHLLSPCAPNPGAPMSLTRTKAPLRWMTYLLHVHFRTVYSHNTSYCVVIQLVTEKSRIPPPMVCLNNPSPQLFTWLSISDQFWSGVKNFGFSFLCLNAQKYI